MNITVYLGSTFGENAKFKDEILKLGELIAEGGHTLVYGGSKTGLMGLLADTVLQNGGKVVGVETCVFMELGYGHDGLTEMVVAEDISERKKIMFERGDIFVAFPGGPGTLEEISEIFSKIKLEEFKGYAVLLNIDGFYKPLVELLDSMHEQGFMSDECRKRIVAVSGAQDLLHLIGN